MYLPYHSNHPNVALQVLVLGLIKCYQEQNKKKLDYMEFSRNFSNYLLTKGLRTKNLTTLPINLQPFQLRIESILVTLFTL